MSQVDQGTFSPLTTITTVGGLTVNGYAPGTFIRWTKRDDDFSDVVGAQGEVARAFNPSQRHTVEITLLQTSSSNGDFAAILQADRQTNQGRVPIVTTQNGVVVAECSIGWIRKVPDASRSGTIENRAWTFDTADGNILDPGISV